MAAHSSILAGEFHGQGSLADYSPPGRKESDMSERLTLHFIHRNLFFFFFLKNCTHSFQTVFPEGLCWFEKFLSVIQKA